MSTLQTSEQQKQEEQQSGVKHTHPRYAYDTLWQSDIARCELGQPAVLGVHCRCGGKLFSARRGNDFAFFAGLAADDPHSFLVPVPTSAVASLLVKRHAASHMARQEIRQEVLL
jgi:hypothetical protein